MRLTPIQQQITKTTAGRVRGTANRVCLFGSRTDETRWGGDIDLLIETEAVLPNRAKILCKLHGALTFALGERKLDILLKDASTQDMPIFNIVKRAGLIL